MNMTTRIQLSTMMFLQFFIWGAWFVTMGSYLGAIGFDGKAIGNSYSTTAWAAILSPFFIGMVADRFFSAQKVLGVLHLLGAVLMYWASTITTPGLFFIVVLGYALCYMPTLALVNAISFNQMTNPGTEFPPIRVLGTLGWIIAGTLITLLNRFVFTEFNLEMTAIPLKLAAGCSLLLGFYSFTLPNTPPKSTGKAVTVSDVLGLEALKLMKDRSFAIFVISSLLVCIPLAFYYAFANPFLNASGMEDVAFKMTFGQMSEFFFMLVMPFFFARLGIKKMLVVGMLAWALRYVLFAFGNSDTLVFMFYGGILLHGICYDFFFVTGQIYVDNKAPKEIQASAQGFIALITYGVGMVIGNAVAGRIVTHWQVMEDDKIVDHVWRTIWLFPAVMSLGVVLLFARTFRENKQEKAEA